MRYWVVMTLTSSVNEWIGSKYNVPEYQILSDDKTVNVPQLTSTHVYTGPTSQTKGIFVAIFKTFVLLCTILYS